MKNKLKTAILLICIPFLIGFITSRYGPWWGLREQTSAPTTPSNGVKFWCDSNNNVYVLNESGSNYQLDTYDPNSGLVDPTSIGTLSLGSASITDSSGTISFGNENLTTTGSLTFASGYLDGYLYRSSADNNTALYLRDDRASIYSGGRVMIDAIETTQDILYIGYDGSNDIDVSIGPNQAIFVEGSSEIITTQEVIRSATPQWYYCKYMDVISLSPGGSGATLTVSSANTLGGYLLDAANEYLYFNGKACSNWDPNTNIEVKIIFEVNIDNSGGNAGDTVDLSILSYYKGDGETANKTQTDEVANTVGQSAQYKQFISSHTFEHDAVDNNIDSEDTFVFRLNLETDTSEVDNIIVNFIIFRYQTSKLNVEI